MCIYLMYCEFVRFAFIVSHSQEESNTQQYTVEIICTNIPYENINNNSRSNRI